jgi:hypothetical protein
LRQLLDPTIDLGLWRPGAGNPEQAGMAAEREGESCVLVADRAGGIRMGKEPGWFGIGLNVLRSARRFMFVKNDIHVEAAKGNTENLCAILAAHPEAVNLIDKMDFGTPLHWAAVYGQADTCEVLLEAGADLKLVDDLGHSPLFWAIAGNEPSIVELLISRGADVKLKDPKGVTPLQYALNKKMDEVAAILRQHGASEAEAQDAGK